MLTAETDPTYALRAWVLLKAKFPKIGKTA
jgi:hypothetical protein